MKRALVLSILLTFCAAIIAQAGGQGAVKAPFDPDVGWVILNSVASNRLVASAHLDDGLPNEVFEVTVRIRYEDNTVDVFQNIATLTTNSQGKGNVSIQVPFAPPEGSQTLRRVAFRVRRPGPPNILYVAVVWDLPLKG